MENQSTTGVGKIIHAVKDGEPVCGLSSEVLRRSPEEHSSVMAAAAMVSDDLRKLVSCRECQRIVDFLRTELSRQ